jgi:hypothetical protein
MQTSQLPYLDEHATAIAAGVDDVWLALIETLDQTFSRTHATSFARTVRCADRTASGPRPLAEGSTIPGFRVAAAAPGSELALEGRHRFSAYALIFRLDQVNAGRSLLRAESRAAFPGLAGGVYRLLVVGTGGHIVATRRLLSAIASRSESRARTRTR